MDKTTKAVHDKNAIPTKETLKIPSKQKRNMKTMSTCIMKSPNIAIILLLCFLLDDKQCNPKKTPGKNVGVPEKF